MAVFVATVWNVLDNNLKWFTTCQLLACVNVIYQDYIQYCNECLCKSKAVAAGGAYLQKLIHHGCSRSRSCPSDQPLKYTTWTNMDTKLLKVERKILFQLSWWQILVTVQFARNSFETTSLPGGVKLWDWGFTDSLCKWYLWLIRCVRTKVRTTLPCECRVLPLFFSKSFSWWFRPPGEGRRTPGGLGIRTFGSRQHQLHNSHLEWPNDRNVVSN